MLAPSIIWAPFGASDQGAVFGTQRLRVHRADIVDRTGQMKSAGWDGYLNGRRRGRWLTETAAKRAIERRALGIRQRRRR